MAQNFIRADEIYANLTHLNQRVAVFNCKYTKALYSDPIFLRFSIP
jgi:hypothetical protein